MGENNSTIHKKGEAQGLRGFLSTTFEGPPIIHPDVEKSGPTNGPLRTHVSVK